MTQKPVPERRVILDARGKPVVFIEQGRRPLGFQPPRPQTMEARRAA